MDDGLLMITALTAAAAVRYSTTTSPIARSHSRGAIPQTEARENLVVIEEDGLQLPLQFFPDWDLYNTSPADRTRSASGESSRDSEPLRSDGLLTRLLAVQLVRFTTRASAGWLVYGIVVREKPGWRSGEFERVKAF